MTIDDVFSFLGPALRALYADKPLINIEDAFEFEKLLGREEYSNWYHRCDNTPINPEYKRELVALAEAGPNAHFVLKMIQAKRGLIKEEVR